MSKRSRCDQDKAFLMFRNAYDLAEELNQPSAMISATVGIAKLLGLNEPDKKQVAHSDSNQTTGFNISIVRSEANTTQKLSFTPAKFGEILRPG